MNNVDILTILFMLKHSYDFQLIPEETLIICLIVKYITEFSYFSLIRNFSSGSFL